MNKNDNEVAAQKETVPRKKSRLAQYFRKDQLEMYLMMFPVFLQRLIFAYIPMAGAIVAFKRYKVSKGIWKSPWVGFDNFKFFFKSMDLRRVLRNTIGYNLVFILTGVVFAVFVALLLSFIRSRRSLKVYQTTLLFPHFMSWVVVSYMLLAFLDYKSGIINGLLNRIGIEPISWYSTITWWPLIFLILNLWKTVGNNSLIYYGAIINVDTSLYESAALDGCSTWKTITKITLPIIKPTIVVLVIMAVGGIFHGDFGLFYTVPKNSTALIEVTEILDTYLYRVMFVTGDVGVSAAVGLIQSVVGLFMTIGVNKLAKSVDESLALF